MATFKTLPAGTTRANAHMAAPILDANNVVQGFTASGGDTYPLATLATDPLTGKGVGISDAGAIAFSDGAIPATTASTTTDASVTKTYIGALITYRENSLPRVVSGGFQTIAAALATSKAWYGEWNVPQGITRIGCEFKFTAGSGGSTGLVALMPWQGSATALAQTPPTAAHLTISRWQWVLSKISVINGGLTMLATGSFNTALAAGTVYKIEMAFDAVQQKAYLLLPDGTTATVSDAAFATLGTYAGFEVFTNATTDDIPAIRRVWASPSDLTINAFPEYWMASASTPRKPTNLTLTSVTGTTNPVPTSLAVLDTTPLPINYGKQGNRVLITGQIWIASLPAAATYNVYVEFTDTASPGGVWTSSFGTYKLMGVEGSGRAGWGTFSFAYAINSPGLPVTATIKHIAVGSVILYVGIDAPVSITCTPID